MRKTYSPIAFSFLPVRRCDGSGAKLGVHAVTPPCDRAGEKRKYWHDLRCQTLADPLAYRFEDIRDYGLNESAHELIALL